MRNPDLDTDIASAGGLAAALAEHRRLTARDLALLDLLHTHQVLTTDQITRLYFHGASTARHRLVHLARRGVLARFRRHQHLGTQPWRYTVGPLGAILHAATTGETIPRPSRTTHRVLTLAASPRLDHLIAVNEFFVALAHHARTHRPHPDHPNRHGPNRHGPNRHGPGARPDDERTDSGATGAGPALSRWWSEQQATTEYGQIVRPDGYGEWTEHDRTVGFFLELDRGTEPLPRVLDKLTGYRHLADLGVHRAVLFLLPTTQREQHLHTHPAGPATGAARGLVVATAAADHLTATATHPADHVWRAPGAHTRVRLIDLASTDPPGLHR